MNKYTVTLDKAKDKKGKYVYEKKLNDINCDCCQKFISYKKDAWEIVTYKEYPKGKTVDKVWYACSERCCEMVIFQNL